MKQIWHFDCNKLTCEKYLWPNKGSDEINYQMST